jgi:hypothetical protein
MTLVAFRRRRLAAALPWLCLLLGCGGESPSKAPGVRSAGAPSGSASTAAPAPSPGNPLQPALCSRSGSDAVRDVFCVDVPPVIPGLSELEKLLGMDFAAADAGDGYTTGGYSGTGAPRVVLLGHSTALSGALVSPINPRAIVFSTTFVFLAFNRGVQQVELAALDRHLGKMNLYLVDFQQACNEAAPGCAPGDLFTPRIESGFTHVVIRDDEDLKDTPSDCRQCHQRAERKPVLLMRELDGPWTHFFGPADYQDSTFPEPSGSDLVRDYLAAKGDEPYAGIPSGLIRATIGLTLENLVDFPQPLLFDGSVIMNERWPWTEATGYVSAPVRSQTWDAAYEAFKRGEQLPLPYFAPRATDPEKQARLSGAYQRYLSGELSAEALPDFADVFPDDPQTRAEIGLGTEPGANPAAALVQACGTCHNDVLDQTISRARFNIAISRLARPELDEAVARLRLPPGAAGAMPPRGRRQLDPGAVNFLVDYLKSDQRPSADDFLLEQAARSGMAPKARF